MIVAITRQPCASLARCELLHLPRTEIDFRQARLQHRRYEDELSDLGCVILRLPSAAELPAAVFIEDAWRCIRRFGDRRQAGRAFKEVGNSAGRRALACLSTNAIH
jgi:hypothetical protein